MSRAQLNKSLKAFGHPPTFEQQSQLVVLQQQFEAAEQSLALLESTAAPAPAVAPVKDADLKRAKIQVAMRRAELKKAQTQHAPAEQIETLERALSEAEQALHAAEALSGQPLPDLTRVEKRPIDSQLRQLKTELAYARADVSKLERRADTPPNRWKRPALACRKPSVRWMPMSPLDAVDERLQQAMQRVLLATLPGMLTLFWLYGWGS